jgi:hypothetical protein
MTIATASPTAAVATTAAAAAEPLAAIAQPVVPGTTTNPQPPPLPLLPVILQFTDIAANSNINFTFTTAGAYWSLGARSGDSLGFSYNVTPASADSDSCIQSIEFNNAVLSIRTGEIDQTSNAFTLTLFLQVNPKVDYLQGYCTLNNEAVVMATIGAQSPVEWRNGRISAVLAGPESSYRSVSFLVQGAKPGNRVDVIATTKVGLGKVNWSLGPPFAQASGVQLSSNQGLIPLTSMSYGVNTLSFVTSQADDAASGNPGNELEFMLSCYIVWAESDLNYIYLRTTCNSDISVYAQVGNRQPQIVSQADTVFTL